jgi:hypothetical protein
LSFVSSVNAVETWAVFSPRKFCKEDVLLKSFNNAASETLFSALLENPSSELARLYRGI